MFITVHPTRLVLTEEKLSQESMVSNKCRAEINSLKEVLIGEKEKFVESVDQYEAMVSKLKLSHVDQVARMNCDIDRYAREARGKNRE